MSWFVVDCEADGPAPGLSSMICFGAIRLDRDLQTTFYGETAPITDDYDKDLDRQFVGGITREQHEAFPDPAIAMTDFANFIQTANRGGHPVFVTDNLAFDWQWINYYFHRFIQRNPFGHSGRRIGDLWAGFRKNAKRGNDWKKFRVTSHTHNPVDDTRGNAEALLKMAELGLEIPLYD